MTQRSLPVGTSSTVIIKAGTSVTVTGYEGDRVTAETNDKWGLKIEKRSPAEIGRARAVMGDVVLFDWRLKRPTFAGNSAADDIIEVQLGSGGQVKVPLGVNLKVYAGQDIEVQGMRGRIDAFAGRNLRLHGVSGLGHASAGRSMQVECETLLENKAEFKAGADLRLQVRDLTSAHLRVKDLGGFWEARIGAGLKSVTLKCGGDVTLATDQEVAPLPPNYLLGKIEKINL